MEATQCPGWMYTAGISGSTAVCRFPFVPLLVVLVADFAVALLLGYGRIKRPLTTRSVVQVIYCLWFAVFLPAHLTLRWFLLLHAVLMSMVDTVMRGRLRCVCSAFRSKDLELVEPGDGVAALLLFLGACVEAAFLLLLSGAVALPVTHWVPGSVILMVFWIGLCVINKYFAPWHGVFGWGTSCTCIGLVAPSVFHRDVTQLLFVHYVLGAHPEVEDFARAREHGRDMDFLAALYRMARPWLEERDAIEELRRVLQDGNVACDPERLDTQLKPFSGFFGRDASAQLSWPEAWKPLLEAGGGAGVVDVLDNLDVTPSADVADASIHEAVVNPRLVPPDVLQSLLRVCFSRGDLAAVPDKLGWSDVWGPITKSLAKARQEAHRSGADTGTQPWGSIMLKILTQHGVHPTRRVFEAAFGDKFVAMAHLEPLLSSLPSSAQSGPSQAGLLSGIGDMLEWERHWRPAVMGGYGNFVSLLVRLGIEPSAHSVEMAINERAPTKALEPLLRGAKPKALGGLGPSLPWEKVWRPMLVDEQDLQRLQLVCDCGVSPSPAVAQAAIKAVASAGPDCDAGGSGGSGSASSSSSQAAPGGPAKHSRRLNGLAILLHAASRQASLAEVGAEFNYKDVWQPLACALDGPSLVDLLWQHGIVPTSQVVEAAVRGYAPAPSHKVGGPGSARGTATAGTAAGRAVDQTSLPITSLERLLASAASRFATDRVGEKLEWEVWEPAVLRGDAKWIQTLCQNCVWPTQAIVETMLCTRAPLACMQAILLTPDPRQRAPDTNAEVARQLHSSSRPALNMLEEVTWTRLAEREDDEAETVAKLCLAATKYAPPRDVVVSAFAKFCSPSVVAPMVVAVAERMQSPGASSESGDAPSRLELPKQLWLKLVGSVGKAAVEAASMTAIAAVKKKEAEAASMTAAATVKKIAEGERAAALLAVGLQFCQEPMPDLVDEMWSLAVHSRAPAVVRLLRENGVKLSVTPRKKTSPPPPIDLPLSSPQSSQEGKSLKITHSSSADLRATAGNTGITSSTKSGTIKPQAPFAGAEKANPQTRWLPTMLGGVPVLVREERNMYLVDNSQFQADTLGIGFRLTRDFRDLDEEDGMYAKWGEYVEVISILDGWAQVKLPKELVPPPKPPAKDPSELELRTRWSTWCGRRITAEDLLVEATKPPRVNPFDDEAFAPPGHAELKGVVGAVLQQDLIHELVKCDEVRAHLEYHAQGDRNAALDPDGFTPRTTASRALRIAARLMGREALRVQGKPVCAARLPPVQPLPSLLTLEVGALAGGATENDAEVDTKLKAFAPFEGMWRRRDASGRTGFRIHHGVLEWPAEYGRASAKLTVLGAMDLEMELESGAKFIGTLQEDDSAFRHRRLVWSDGDVWVLDADGVEAHGEHIDR